MSWLSVFFKKDSVKAFLNLAFKLLKTLLGQIGENLLSVAKQEVYLAEKSGKTGTEKYNEAFKAIKRRFPELRESAINLAIEIAVNALTASQA